MVSQAYNHLGDKRHNRAFSPYVGSSGYAEARVYVPPQPDTRTLMSEHQTNPPDPPRKRIAVACGRCRQRKIRCSGDLGQNMPCSNCKSAGVTQCLFLRVSSRETPIKSDLALGQLGGALSGHAGSSLRSEFNYNPVIARTLASHAAVPPSPNYSTYSCPSGSTNTAGSIGGSVGASTIGRASGGTSGGPSGGTCASDFAAAGEPLRSSSLHPYVNKSYLSSMTPWGAGYGEDCVDYTVPACSPYAVASDAAGQLVSYQPWDVRSKQVNVGVGTIPDALSVPSVPPVNPTTKTSDSATASSPGPSPVHHTSRHGNTGTSSTSNTTTASSTANTTPYASASTTADALSPNTTSGATSLVYRLATDADNDDYRHANSSLPLSDRLLGHTLPSSLASKSSVSAAYAARRGAPSPVPGPHPHAHPHSHAHAVPHSIPHSVPARSSAVTPYNTAPYTSHTSHMSQPSGGSGSTTDHVSPLSLGASSGSSLGPPLGYPTRASPVDHHAGYGSASASITSGGGLFSDQDREVGLQGSGGGPSSSASYLSSYTYAPGTPRPSSAAMARQKSKKKTASSESLVPSNVAQTSSTAAVATTGSPAPTTTAAAAMHRVYSPTDGPAPPPLYEHEPQHHDTRSDTLCTGSHSQDLQHTQHAPNYRV
ncbi:uncharacterized protein SPSK_08783 [Sporothrix schenckii 1099-18]|uniref:Zn(2)-C6 fungal-type domain-containing protein n=1 Tax=Sporothrix schenckii 1099-18 TaxID=1397361 RepID=A0A0F2M678_SPOSC|nr:uncharacterized protein SPSK_08783 [Sporothrix schenckii 1099-18]KJR85137.1 hypothetical protein SPSK_08783 [Sporothrix schenckii 1099-18]